jgi:2-deoxy-D-gluconate 3-dehydrogenase|nr:SDR family oxidoreductase [Clostridium vitabionis]
MSALNMFDVAGKKAIVTGATRGLGRGMAEGLLEGGAEVVVIGTKERGTAGHPGALDVADEYTAKGYKCHGLAANLDTLEAGEDAFKKAVSLLGGGLDILIVAHGIQRRHQSNEFPADEWHEVIGTNLDSVFGLARPASDLFVKKAQADGVVPITNGPKKCYGKIILIASMASFFGGKTVPAYASAKGGVAQLTKCMSNDLLGYGININALAPGYMDTEMNAALTDPANPRFMELTNRIPAHRWGTGDDMKGPALFLSSDASNYLGGAVIPVDGGYLVM